VEMTELLDRHEDKWMPEPNSGCYIWTAAVGTHGRPVVWSNVTYKMELVSRLVCKEAYGDRPDKLACHKPPCNEGLCVREEHLYWGDHDSNVKDMIKQGRGRNGAS